MAMTIEERHARRDQRRAERKRIKHEQREQERQDKRELKQWEKFVARMKALGAWIDE